MTQKIVVIGGSAAGPKTAAKARRLDQHAEIVLFQKAPDLSMASCGYPYYVGGTFDDRNQLVETPTGVIRDTAFFLKAKGITAYTQTEVTAIRPDKKTITYKNLLTGEEGETSYDKLVIATGATPNIPPVPGRDLKGITTLQSMQDAEYLRAVRDSGMVKHAVVIGGGLIGMETCEALNLAGIEITVVELLPQILMFLDWDLAKILETHVKTKAARVVTNNPVTEFLGTDGHLSAVRLKDGAELPCQLAVIAIGVRPNVQLAREAKLAVGERGGIAVNEYMQTSDPDIYAVGDCIEVTQRITGKKVLAPFGDLANLEGRVAAQNIVNGNAVTFPGTIQTGVCKLFDFAAGSTGLSEKAARECGFKNVVSVVTAAPDKPHFMDAKLLVMKLVADADTGRILGMQCVGPGDVSKRVAEAAMAIMGKMTVTDVATADLPYAPPFSPAIDNFIAAAHVLENKILGRMKGLSATEFKKKLDAGDDMFILDARGTPEFDAMRLGVGEHLIPLGALRARIQELPEDKDKEIICYCKISLRGYEAASFLEAQGYTNVKVLEGGIMAWPYEREK
ncbi:MAG: pyridine nucleotide-disulfide oxidoreductase [Spartobacteria bacterium]|nr:pyridine nucleotide-disulfide oxidoreductase [Spartobacteria bacterium]